MSTSSQEPKPTSFGGVVIDDEGRVLLREPKNHYDGYVWTFAKGRADPGETEQAAALREVREELGVVAEIVAPIPGVFRGGTGSTRYWLMRAVSTGAPTDGETDGVMWATHSEATALISQTGNARGRARDLAVLDAAAAQARLSSRSTRSR